MRLAPSHPHIVYQEHQNRNVASDRLRRTQKIQSKQVAISVVRSHQNPFIYSQGKNWVLHILIPLSQSRAEPNNLCFWAGCGDRYEANNKTSKQSSMSAMAVDCVVAGTVGKVGVLSTNLISSASARATLDVSGSAKATSPTLQHWQLGSRPNGPAGPSSSSSSSLLAPSLPCVRRPGWASSRQQQGSGNEKWLQVLCAQGADSSSSTALSAETKPVSSKFVVVLGATGGVGQLLVASLLEKGVKVRALLRSEEKAKSLFGDKLGEQLEIRTVDTRQRETLDEALFEGITHVINATGTTAFPSKRWDGDNGPEQTDWIGVRNLIDALPKSVQRIVLVSSVGVTKSDKLPFNIMNLFGVLKYKKMGEDHLRKSGIPFTIIRPARLTDGPYTSYDLNTLLQATTGTRRAVVLGQGDKLVGEASRVVVAEACIHALDLDCTVGQTYEVQSIEGDGPGKDAEKWASIFQSVHS